jgi:hypothetical protein
MDWWELLLKQKRSWWTTGCPSGSEKPPLEKPSSGIFVYFCGVFLSAMYSYPKYSPEMENSVFF